jgi:hypothetical protein
MKIRGKPMLTEDQRRTQEKKNGIYADLRLRGWIRVDKYAVVRDGLGVENCVVCTYPFEMGQRVAVIGVCGHGFHWRCLREGLDEEVVGGEEECCPVC